MTLHLICAFQAIIVPDKRAAVFFHYFFLQIPQIAEIRRKANKTTTPRPPVRYISQTLTSFELYSCEARMGL